MYNNITLEISLKPFKKTDDEYIKTVCRNAFEQWKPLIKNVPVISLMFWSADGSELLDYKGNEDDTFEWAYLIGGANNREGDTSAIDPEGIGLHSRNYLYMDNPPKMTYGILKRIIRTFKETGKEMFPEKTIRVGTTFDPGPEFAKSSFKYERHNEICTGGDMGFKTFICSYAELDGDDVAYAAYPNGIPDKTPFGTFLGKQANVFLKDMDFDYIWLSNGLGFGREPWSANGAIFDGKTFNHSELARIRKNAIDFWEYFRKECPDYPIEVRGTNMSTGIDLSTDGIPLKDIYDGGYNLLPPPNSPWAALNYDFGLELMGYMSRISYLPDEKFLFRYYIHDPWWVNSPWYDRYNQMPHDIYLPMSIGKIDKNGKVLSPTNLNLLSIDNSYGNMPDSCANETIPHILRAAKEVPDEPSPLVWVYPFEEYSNCKDEQDLNEMYSEDWYIRGAINNGLPLSSVTSTTDFVVQNKDIYKSSILISAIPDAGTEYEKAIISYINTGGRVIFYGNTKKSSSDFRKTIGIEQTDEISGIFDIYVDGKNCGKLNHRELISAGGLNAVATDSICFAECSKRAVGVKKGSAIWLRGSVSANYTEGCHVLVPDDANEYFISETLMLKALGMFGYKIEFDNPENVKSPVLMIHRYNNAFMFSGYLASTTVKTKLRFPYGMPILDGYESRLSDGFAEYNFPKAEHRECRVFVEQESGIVGCREVSPVSHKIRRRVCVYGLKNATVRFLAEDYCKDNIEAILNSHGDFWFVGDKFDGGYVNIDGITFYEARNVTGELVLSMPNK